MELFKNLLDYGDYIKENPFYDDLEISLEDFDNLDAKVERETYETADASNKIPIPPELDDLIRLHYLATSRKVTTILEFGVGKSTTVFDHALELNKKKYSDYVEENLRRSNLFECHSVDNNKEWIEITKSNYKSKNVHFHHSACVMSTFNSRICTLYENLPNICPDLIYIDAPDQFSPIGDVRGISTNHPDRLPMAADVLTIEHFLLPGTLIVLDGRTANARFLQTNLQRNWAYHHLSEYDQHFFELKEEPLGIYNQKQIEFCLGKDWK